ncbi:ATP-binding protein [bacterium]|nr:ATP-binding protein [bacterium]
MYKRNIENLIKNLSKSYRCITLIGPRQSGKTTLSKKIFPEFDYYSFESPDVREMFSYDPRGFLEGVDNSCIFDEVQKVPELFSYLQEVLDDKKDKRKFVLSGSNNLKLSSKVSQTLAGRTRILQILPLTYSELPKKERKKGIDESMLYGSFPRIFDEKLNPTEWLSDYFQTYVEKDIRETINISNLKSFNNFIRLLAGRVGQIVNFNSLGSDAGVTQPTAKAWLSALETTFICYTLSPHYKNFNKRLIKSPKVYFYDVGLLCYLLRIKNVDQLEVHPLKGLIFENWVVSEYMKYYSNLGEEAPLYFWRDQHGHEIDLVIDNPDFLELIEVKSGKTFNKDFFKNINWLNNLQDRKTGTCIYGGSKKIDLGDLNVVPWNKILDNK